MNESKNLRNKIIITNFIRYKKIITDTNTNGKEKSQKSIREVFKPFTNDVIVRADLISEDKEL